jgi:hypothetical protein
MEVDRNPSMPSIKGHPAYATFPESTNDIASSSSLLMGQQVGARKRRRSAEYLSGPLSPSYDQDHLIDFDPGDGEADTERGYVVSVCIEGGKKKEGYNANVDPLLELLETASYGEPKRSTG